MGRLVLKDFDDSLRFFTVVNAGYDEKDGMWFEVYGNTNNHLLLDTINVAGISKADSDAHILQLLRHGYLDLSEHEFEYQDEQEEV